jgi:hypothetical protein
LIYPFLRADCESGPIGFWTNADHLKLDGNETCGTIPAGFVLRFVQAIDFCEPPGAAYDAVT